MKTTLKRYRLLYKLSEIHGRTFIHPTYLNSIYGFPDIYAKEHMKLVSHCVTKCQKFDKNVVYINPVKHTWM